VSSSVRQRFVRGAAANFIAVAFNQGSTLVANILVARLLDKATYGEYAIVVNTLLTVGTMAQLSTGYTASKYLAEFRMADKARAGRILGACAKFSMISAAIGALAIVIFSKPIANDIFQAPHLALPLALGAGFLGASALNGYQSGALAGLEAFNRLALAGIVSGIGAILLIAGGSWLGGLNGALAGLTVAGVVRWFIHARLLHAELQRQQIIAIYCGSLTAERSVFLHFTLPAALAGYLTIPAIWLSNTILIRQPDGFNEMALFAASNAVRVVVLFAPLTANAVMVSIINNLFGEPSKSLFLSTYGFNLVITTGVTLGIAAMAALFAPYMLLAFGSEFATGLPITYLLLGAAVGEALSTALNHRIQARSQIWRMFFFVVLPREMIFMTSVLLLVPGFAGAGLGAAYFIAWTTCAGLAALVSITSNKAESIES
jgi:O-antigen/teichoic acid export membrane protein